jgi:hypothetical protein
MVTIGMDNECSDQPQNGWVESSDAFGGLSAAMHRFRGMSQRIDPVPESLETSSEFGDPIGQVGISRQACSNRRVGRGKPCFETAQA